MGVRYCDQPLLKFCWQSVVTVSHTLPSLLKCLDHHWCILIFRHMCVLFLVSQSRNAMCKNLLNSLILFKKLTGPEGKIRVYLRCTNTHEKSVCERDTSFNFNVFLPDYYEKHVLHISKSKKIKKRCTYSQEKSYKSSYCWSSLMTFIFIQPAGLCWWSHLKTADTVHCWVQQSPANLHLNEGNFWSEFKDKMPQHQCFIWTFLKISQNLQKGFY